MPEWPTNQYVEIRNDGYFVAGTRIGLDVLIYDFRRGKSAEELFKSYPSIGSLARVYGAITFVLEHPDVIEEYLQEMERTWEEIERTHPLPPGTVEQFRRWKEEKVSKP